MGVRSANLKCEYKKVVGNFSTYTYPSMGAFVTDVMRGENSSYEYGSSQKNSYSFSLSSNIKQALDILMGSHDKIKQISSNLRSLEGKAVEFMPQANKFSGRVSVPAMLSGVENCRNRFREEETKKPTVTLSVQINDNCGIPAEYFVNKATAVANAINELEKNGMRVELYGYTYSEFDGGKKEMVLIKMKRFEDTLSLGQLYGLFAPSTFRRLWFRHLELFWAGSYVPDGYGMSIANSQHAPGINIPTSGRYNSIDSSVRYINEYIREGLNDMSNG